MFMLLIIGISFILLPSKVSANIGTVLVAKVIDAEGINENDGLLFQNVRVEVLKGEYKGVTTEVQVPFQNDSERPLQTGDRIMIRTIEVNDDVYFQFYDFSRSKNYVWLLLLFIIVVVAFLGLRGLKTLIPSFSIVLFVIIGLIPSIIDSINLTALYLSLIGIIAGLTAWIRLRHKLLAVIVLFSVMLCLFSGYLIFAGFANVSYIEPFLGTTTSVTNKLNMQVIDIVYMSALFIPAGGVINASIQVSKYLLDDHEKGEKNDLTKMLKSGLKLGQKISAGEMNNLIIMIIGLSLAGIFMITETLNDMSFWDHGWISLQIIYLVSSSLSILLITPITVFITSGFLSLINSERKGRAGQQKLNIQKTIKDTTRRFKYFK